MKKILLMILIASVVMLGSCKKEPDGLSIGEEKSFVKSIEGDIIPGQYVVMLKNGVTSVKSAKLSYQNAQVLMRSEMQKVLQISKISEKEPLQVYTSSTEGFAVNLSEEEAMALEKNPLVQGVWPDRMIVLGKPGTNPKPVPAQVTPPGITMVGGGTTYSGSNKVYIIDTGIDLTHPDLNVDVESGKTFIARTTTPNDDNGHGTHCAGIIAAIDNNIGVVGVAAGANVVPIKVLDKRGSGAYSVVMAGVDFVIANGSPGDAVNMSLGGGAYPPLDDLVVNMGEKGLFVALAAGNERDDANNHSPARANGKNIYTVSACDKNGIWASFSNYGSPPIDYCAPGVSILSLYKGGSTATMSGTSMAAPHVCGVLLTTKGIPKSEGSVSGDPDGNADPIVHN
ncbi:MAG TPA: S8 family serine peptidase [Anaerovoracaceae bacterium]|nr:S8 family serine peptidase [Anaerovoracaceae bacterium]